MRAYIIRKPGIVVCYTSKLCSSKKKYQTRVGHSSISRVFPQIGNRWSSPFTRLAFNKRCMGRRGGGSQYKVLNTKKFRLCECTQKIDYSSGLQLTRFLPTIVCWFSYTAHSDSFSRRIVERRIDLYAHPRSTLLYQLAFQSWIKQS